MTKQVNQIGNGNAGRDIHRQEQPKEFKMPEVMKDDLQLRAEAFLAHLENIFNMHSLLRNEIVRYQEGNFTSAELEHTMDFIKTKLNAFQQ